MRSIDDTHLHGTVVSLEQEEWNSEITEQVSDQKTVWRNQRGIRSEGMLPFSSIENNKSKINLRGEYEPQGTIGKIDYAIVEISQQVEGD